MKIANVPTFSVPSAPRKSKEEAALEVTSSTDVAKEATLASQKASVGPGGEAPRSVRVDPRLSTAALAGSNTENDTGLSNRIKARPNVQPQDIKRKNESKEIAAEELTEKGNQIVQRARNEVKEISNELQTIKSITKKSAQLKDVGPLDDNKQAEISRDFKQAVDRLDNKVRQAEKTSAELGQADFKEVVVDARTAVDSFRNQNEKAVSAQPDAGKPAPARDITLSAVFQQQGPNEEQVVVAQKEAVELVMNSGQELKVKAVEVKQEKISPNAKQKLDKAVDNAQKGFQRVEVAAEKAVDQRETGSKVNRVQLSQDVVKAAESLTVLGAEIEEAVPENSRVQNLGERVREVAREIRNTFADDMNPTESIDRLAKRVDVVQEKLEEESGRRLEESRGDQQAAATVSPPPDTQSAVFTSKLKL